MSWAFALSKDTYSFTLYKEEEKGNFIDLGVNEIQNDNPIVERSFLFWNRFLDSKIIINTPIHYEGEEAVVIIEKEIEGKIVYILTDPFRAMLHCLEKDI